jgi:hypothetical protein
MRTNTTPLFSLPRIKSPTECHWRGDECRRPATHIVSTTTGGPVTRDVACGHCADQARKLAPLLDYVTMTVAPLEGGR